MTTKIISLKENQVIEIGNSEDTQFSCHHVLNHGNSVPLNCMNDENWWPPTVCAWMTIVWMEGQLWENNWNILVLETTWFISWNQGRITMESANLWTCNCISFEYSLNQTPLKISSINPIPTLAPQKSITKPITCSIYPSPSQNPISSSKYPQNAQFLIEMNPSSSKACLTTPILFKMDLRWPHFFQNGPQILTEAPLFFRRTHPFLKTPSPCQNGL